MLLRVLLPLLIFINLIANKPSNAQPNKSSNIQYIRIEYTGEASKPYTKIFLGLPHSMDSIDSNFFTRKFTFTEEGLYNIKRLTEREHFMDRDTILGDAYNVAFIGTYESTIFVTSYLSRIKELFQLASEQLGADPANCSRFKGAVESIITILRLEGRLTSIQNDK